MKILPTIGPASEKNKDLKFLFKYCSMVRLNTSHNNIMWHKKMINLIKKIDNRIDILVDIPGVKPRTNNKKDIIIKKNDLVKFGYKIEISNKKTIQLTRGLPQKKNKINKCFSLDDGKIIFKTKKNNKNFIIGKALHDCTIKPKKGLNIPDSIYDNSEQKKIYIKYLNTLKNTNINAIGLSFVQSKGLVI